MSKALSASIEMVTWFLPFVLLMCDLCMLDHPFIPGTSSTWSWYLISCFAFFFFWLRWVIIALRGLSLVVVSWGYSPLQSSGFSTRWLLLSRSTGSGVHWLWWLRLPGCRAQVHCSVVVMHGLHCSMARGIFLDQGSNPCLLHWQVDSLPLSPQGSL